MSAQAPSVPESIDYSLKDRVVIVTGAGAGIGQAIAQLLAARGARLALVGRSESVEALACELGDAARAYVFDVQNFPGIAPLVDRIAADFGRLDVLVNNAGISICQSALETTEEAWDRTMAVNLKAVLGFSQAAARHFLARGEGKIVNMASQAASVALENHLAYCTSKYGLLGLTQTLALEWGPHNIQVNAISPTVVLTEMGKRAWAGEKGEAMKREIPLRRFARPEDVAAAVLFLASGAADMITGANLLVDGGYTIH